MTRRVPGAAPEHRINSSRRRQIVVSPVLAAAALCCVAFCSCVSAGRAPTTASARNASERAIAADGGAANGGAASTASRHMNRRPVEETTRRDLAPVVAATSLPPARTSDRLAAGADDKVIRQVAYVPPSLPPQAWTGGAGPLGASPALPQVCPPGYHDGAATINYPPQWKPDGLAGPWPYDEYIFDGGDRDTSVIVERDWTVRGLDDEDTVVHYDTRDGKTRVQPSNRVPIYAPRFAAIRKVYGAELHHTPEIIAAVDRPTRASSQDTNLVATTTLQPQQPVLQHGIKTTVGLRERMRGAGVELALLPHGAAQGFLPHEDFLLIRRGEYDVSEKARLAARIQAAYAWSSDQAVQVAIAGQTAYEGKGNNKAAETLMYELPPGKPRVRIVKVASKSEAAPGEEIEFSIRFDNVGDQSVGNVTIIDSLTTRLEYVPESAQCTLKATFCTQENDADSLVLRWEIADPMKVGEGGVIRFKCRTR